MHGRFLLLLYVLVDITREEGRVDMMPHGTFAHACERALALHMCTDAEMRSSLHKGELGMEMMVHVMLEDSLYLDKCAERQRGRAGAANPTTCARFEHVDQSFATGGSVGEIESRRMVELADHLALPAPTDVTDEDILLLHEFVGQGGQATATISTCNLLFRSTHSDLFQLRPCSTEDADKAHVFSLPRFPSDSSLFRTHTNTQVHASWGQASSS